MTDEKILELDEGGEVVIREQDEKGSLVLTIIKSIPVVGSLLLQTAYLLGEVVNITSFPFYVTLHEGSHMLMGKIVGAEARSRGFLEYQYITDRPFKVALINLAPLLVLPLAVGVSVWFMTIPESRTWVRFFAAITVLYLFLVSLPSPGDARAIINTEGMPAPLSLVAVLFHVFNLLPFNRFIWVVGSLYLLDIYNVANL